MKIREYFYRTVVLFLVLAVAVPPGVFSQDKSSGVFKQEELDQMIAPIALYPDSLLAQVLMASTYPLEVVQADRFAKENKGMKGDALTAALEKQEWDPSVKSLVQFPDILAMMSEKLDWTQKLGDAFLSQQEDVMNTVQNLRKKAEEAGNLKTTKEQVVKVEKEVIVIESANPQVVYVPVYNPTVVYGSWWWPSYPPYYYYPPYYPHPTLFGFAAGVAIGAAWGYAWGGFNWHHHHVDINIDRNININKNINRNKYKAEFNKSGKLDRAGKGKWEHNAAHRKGVSYRDQKTARQYNRAATNDAIKSRESFRGRAEQGRKDPSRGGSEQFRERDLNKRGPGDRDMKSRNASRRDTFEGPDRSGSAFSGMDKGGKATRDLSSRGSSSRKSMFSGSGGRSRGNISSGRGGRGRR